MHHVRHPWDGESWGTPFRDSSRSPGSAADSAYGSACDSARLSRSRPHYNHPGGGRRPVGRKSCSATGAVNRATRHQLAKSRTIRSPAAALARDYEIVADREDGGVDQGVTQPRTEQGAGAVVKEAPYHAADRHS